MVHYWPDSGCDMVFRFDLFDWTLVWTLVLSKRSHKRDGKRNFHWNPNHIVKRFVWRLTTVFVLPFPYCFCFFFFSFFFFLVSTVNELVQRVELSLRLLCWFHSLQSFTGNRRPIRSTGCIVQYMIQSFFLCFVDNQLLLFNLSCFFKGFNHT